MQSASFSGRPQKSIQQILSYAIAVTQEVVDKYNPQTISDLIPIASDLRFGAEHAFFTLEGSMKYGPFCDAYGLNFKEHIAIDNSLKYSAVENGNFDVMVVYATDGLNRKAGLKVLEDDLGFFPNTTVPCWYGMPSSRSLPM